MHGVQQIGSIKSYQGVGTLARYTPKHFGHSLFPTGQIAMVSTAILAVAQRFRD